MKILPGFVFHIGKLQLMACFAGALVALTGAVVNPAFAQAETAQVRLGNLVFDVPAVNLVVNGEVIADTEGTATVFGSMTLPETYLDVPAGDSVFAVTADGDAPDHALVGDTTFSLEAGHRYMLALMGNSSEDDLHFTLIDETAAIEAKDISQSAVTIIVNNLAGIPAIDMNFNGQPFFTDLAYGDYLVFQDPVEGAGTLITEHANPDAVILDNPPAVGSPANFFALFAFSGVFSGEMWDGYTALYTGQFEGDVTVTDGGPIDVGDTRTVEFTEMGQRERFTLTLDAPATLDIRQTSGPDLDSFLRMYDPEGSLLRENDEIVSDNFEGNDAGWMGLELDAGTYILEMGTFVDIGTGSFTLTVTNAQ